MDSGGNSMQKVVKPSLSDFDTVTKSARVNFFKRIVHVNLVGIKYPSMAGGV